MFSGEKYLTRRTIWQCCHGGRIIFMPNAAAAAAYKTAASVQAALCPNPVTAGPARAAYAALGASALSASAASISPLPAKMDRGNVVTKEDLIDRAVVVMCPAPKPCVKVVAVHMPALSKCTKIHHKMTQAAETPVLDIIRSLALAGSLCDGLPPPGFVSWITENQTVADELPVAVPEAPPVKRLLPVLPVPKGELDPIQKLQPAKMPEAPPAPVGEDCPLPKCAIQALEVSCVHGGRKAGKENRLMVVASRTREKNTYWAVLGAKIEIKKTWGQFDKINAVAKVGHKGMEDMAFAKGGWKAGARQTFEVEDHHWEEDDLWLATVRGHEKILRARSRCHGSSLAVRVEALPSPKYQYLLAVEFEYLAAAMDGDFLKFFWNKLCKKAYDSAIDGIKPKDKWKQEGVVSASWGWEEDKDWRCFYEVKVQAGARLKFKKDWKKSLTHLILPAWGLLVKHLADLFILVNWEITLSLMGGPNAKFYHAGDDKYSGELEFKAQGYIRVGPGLRLGSDYIASVEASGTVKVQVDAAAKLGLDRSGLKGKAEVKFPEVALNVRVTTKVFYIETSRKDYNWVICSKPEPLWKKEIKLLPPEKAKT